MKNLSFYVPKIEDYWYERKIQSDPKTMNYNVRENRYECGLLIVLKMLCERAKKDGIKSLYDSFEINRDNTLKIFESIGFTVIERTVWKK